MTWFIIEFVVVCALISGFMATHSVAMAIVSAAPVIAAVMWLRSIQVDEAVLWLVGAVPLLASILGLVLGQYVRHRIGVREVTRSPRLQLERSAPGHAMLDAGDIERSAQLCGGTSGFIAVKVDDTNEHGMWARRSKTPLSAAVAGGGPGLEH